MAMDYKIALPSLMVRINFFLVPGGAGYALVRLIKVDGTALIYFLKGSALYKAR
jgi:hypothetical protein